MWGLCPHWLYRTVYPVVRTRYTRHCFKVKVNWAGNKYLGMDIDVDRSNRHVTLSMPGCISRLLQRVRPDSEKGASTPGIYTPPNYHNPITHKATVDTSSLVSDSDKKQLQSVVGTLLYYSRAVNPSIATAVHYLGSIQSKPTTNDMAKMDRLLRYLSSHPNNSLRFYASNMVYQLMSDASYLSRPRARSVGGWLGYLGDAYNINGPVAYASKMIDCVVASVAEAELGSAFMSAQRAVQHRNTLADFGYPQPPTLLRIDNTVALGLADNRLNNRKRSKSMDMRYFWLTDRVRQGHFRVEHIAGKHNIADHFTKTLPKHIFEAFVPFLMVNLNTVSKRLRAKTQTITMPKL